MRILPPALTLRTPVMLLMLIIMFLLGLATLGMMFAFVAACERV